jgi:hypothetical protein
LDHGWVEARDLLPGHELFTSRGGWLRVSGATWRAHSATVYNLEVAEDHTYFAGDAEAWVHNSCGDASKGGLSPAQAKNLGRFENKLPAGADPTVVRELPGGGRAFQANVPGHVPGSRAVYEKQVDAAGKTLEYTKTTYDPAGNIVHVKDKIRGTVIEP